MNSSLTLVSEGCYQIQGYLSPCQSEVFKNQKVDVWVELLICYNQLGTCESQDAALEGSPLLCTFVKD